MQMLPILLKDGYKVGHVRQFPPYTSMIYSNFTPRCSRVAGVDRVVAFGYQYFVWEYLYQQFGDWFFGQPKADVLREYDRRITNYLGPTNSSHIGKLHDLGYLPLKVKALPEGTLCPLRVPALTIRNTNPEFGWLTNMLETLLSNVLWLPSTSATTAFEYRKRFEKYAKLTGAPKAFVPWQGHDFSMRGMAGIEAAMLSGAGHLLSFTGTDTIPAIDFLEEYYGANCETELIGGSVPATEHSVMSMGMQAGELETFRHLITEVYPNGIVSIVSDTWDFWKVLTQYLPALKSEVLAREGKVVIRPDSGDPIKIICGDPDSSVGCVVAGAIETLWNVFGGKVNEEGFKELDSHIGLIYGDSISLDRQEQILSGLAQKGFASSNVVLGIGSYTYQHVTRDTYGWAMKATYGELTGPDGGVRGQAIYKDPKTDDGTKKSATGLLCVQRDSQGELRVLENCTWAEEECGELQTIFLDGEPQNQQTLAQIRKRLESYL